jgi:Ca2+:H+ antiporter
MGQPRGPSTKPTRRRAARGPHVSALAALATHQRILLALGITMSIVAGVLSAVAANAVLVFVVSGAALALLAAMVGEATDQVGSRMGPGATGVLQAAVGNLPELFVGIFALRAGLVTVVQSALIGSILGNVLLVLGLAFLFGGARNGPQPFESRQPRMIATLIALAVAAIAIPTLTLGLHTPAATHEEGLSIACAVVLLAVFVASIPVSLSGGPSAVSTPPGEASGTLWPLWLAIAVLLLAGIGAAFVSDWFVAALTPAIAVLHISQAFTGLVIVALASNAVEHVVGIQLAWRNKPDYAVSVILNSALQVALGLVPVLVLLSFVIGGAHLTLVMPALLVAAVGLAAVLGTIIVYDGESTWLEGVALIGLYLILAASFWWG